MAVRSPKGERPTPEIDEQFLISMMAKEESPKQQDSISTGEISEKDEESKTPLKEENRKRRSKLSDYESLFIKEVPDTARFGKTVYISQEFHERILKIIQVIGKNDVSLYSYVDNVLAHHFAIYQDEITEAYNKNIRSLF